MSDQPCCCGKYTISDEDAAGIIHNDIGHERYGPGRFCGPKDKHYLRDLTAAWEQALRERWLLAKALVLWARNGPSPTGMWPSDENFLTGTVDEAHRILASEPEPPARTGLADPPRWGQAFDRSAEIPALEARVKELEVLLGDIARYPTLAEACRAAEAKVFALEAKVKAMLRDAVLRQSIERLADEIEVVEFPWTREVLVERLRALLASSPIGETAVNPLAARVGELEKGLGKMLDFFETGLEDDGALKSSHPDWIRLARGLFSLSRRLLSPTGETAP